MLEKASKVFNTVRHMTPRQWRYRLYYMARNKLSKRRVVKTPDDIATFQLPTYYSADIGNTEAVKVADGIIRNQIPTVSGRLVEFNGDWNLKGETYRLISFKLNSFRWLLDLSDAYKVTGDRKYIDKGFELIDNWWNKCGSRISGDRWNAYVIAERITNWISFVSEYGKDRADEYAKMIYPQAVELENSLEYQLGANHLLSEAKGLIFAGTFLGNAEIYMTGKKLLMDEWKEQFLPDGGHYERSVSYHVESLQQYFESYVVLKEKGDPDAEIFIDFMREPYKFLNGMIGVNGKIPLFNDAAYDYPFYDARDFLSTARLIYSSTPPCGNQGNYYKRWNWIGEGSVFIDWRSRQYYPETGFIHYQFAVHGKKYSFFMDCGDNGPDYNLGHTHADALSVLLYAEDKEIFVDSGVMTYKPESGRDICRSTKAHNTVEVDGKNNAEIWSAFRVARRGHTKLVTCKFVDGLRVQATYDGYKKILKDPVKHIREVIIRGNQIEIIDRIEGREKHHAISRLHLSPDCRDIEGLNPLLVDKHITVESDGQQRTRDCQIAENFGIVRKSRCIEIDFNGSNSLKSIIKIG